MEWANWASSSDLHVCELVRYPKSGATGRQQQVQSLCNALISLAAQVSRLAIIDAQERRIKRFVLSRSKLRFGCGRLIRLNVRVVGDETTTKAITFSHLEVEAADERSKRS